MSKKLTKPTIKSLWYSITNSGYVFKLKNPKAVSRRDS